MILAKPTVSIIINDFIESDLPYTPNGEGVAIEFKRGRLAIDTVVVFDVERETELGGDDGELLCEATSIDCTLEIDGVFDDITDEEVNLSDNEKLRLANELRESLIKELKEYHRIR